jgi:hypothetical protein
MKTDNHVFTVSASSMIACFVFFFLVLVVNGGDRYDYLNALLHQAGQLH